MAALQLSPQVFAILSALIEERSGMHYAPIDRDLLAEKISPRAMDAGFDSLLDYYYFLRYDAGGETELQALFETLAVHETYFFRELDQVQVLLDEFVVPRVRDGEKVRIWCAACATGEEPLTLAMLLDDRRLLGSVELCASDLSERALSRARGGLFGRRALRGSPPAPLVQRYLTESQGGYRVDPRLLALIDFRSVNLIDQAQVQALGTFHAILCRNVLIYFRDETTTAVVQRLTQALRPEGVMLVGVSESLLRFGTSLVCEERRGAFFYRRAP